MEVGIKTTITASVNTEGEGLFPTSEVNDIISVIDEGRIDIEVAGPHINIKSEKGTSFDIPTLPFQSVGSNVGMGDEWLVQGSQGADYAYLLV